MGFSLNLALWQIKKKAPDPFSLSSPDIAGILVFALVAYTRLVDLTVGGFDLTLKAGLPLWIVRG